MPDWEADSPLLRRNLTALLADIAAHAGQRGVISVELVRLWHQQMLRGLTVPDPVMVGRFRGEAGLRGVEVRVGAYPGLKSMQVAGALDEFDQKLKEVVASLDQSIARDKDLDVDQLSAVLDVCA